MKGLGMRAKTFSCAGSLALASLSLFVGVFAGACGDDDGGPSDAGDTSDGGGGTSGIGMIPRTDASISTDDPVPECDRFDPDACGAGAQCRVVAREQPDGFGVYGGCVKDVPARGLNEPCDPFGGGFDPYAAEGLKETVYVDPCAPGLYCAPDFDIRDHYKCQVACDREAGIGCVEPQFCVKTSDLEIEEICVDSDRCDPSDPSTCPSGEACFLRPNDAQDAVLTLCLAVDEMPLDDGEACTRYNQCHVGSSCWGPTLKPRAEWVMEDLVCRRTCMVGADDDDADAGADDGGVAEGGSCKSGTSCVGFDKSSFDLTHVAGALGQCE
jgi:hypothetical protein